MSNQSRWRVVTALLLVLFPVATLAQSYEIVGSNVKRRADAALALMAFGVVPDLTSSFLSIGSSTENTEKSSIRMTQFAGGATISKETPVYLEGGLAYMRYDPTFVASNGVEERKIPTKWNTLSGTGGIGWDFPIATDLVIRPMFNFALGQVASDAAVGTRFLAWKTDRDIDFLNNGTMNAYGLGGSLMIDYERVRPEGEVDLEWRYTNIQLHTFGSTADGVKGAADAKATSLYARYRAPTGTSLLDRPLRYVLEFAHTTYLGDQRGALGFDYMNSIGVGFELDSSAYNVFVTRTRLVLRYAFGDNVNGYAVGLAMSF